MIAERLDESRFYRGGLDENVISVRRSGYTERSEILDNRLNAVTLLETDMRHISNSCGGGGKGREGGGGERLIGEIRKILVKAHECGDVAPVGKYSFGRFDQDKSSIFKQS